MWKPTIGELDKWRPTAKHYNLAGERVGPSEAPPPSESRTQEAKKSPVGIDLIFP